MGEIGDRDELSADYLNVYSVSGVIEKDDGEAFEKFCEYRVSAHTLNVVGALIFLFTSYVYVMSLINPKSYCFLAAIVAIGYFIRNPIALLAIYFRNRIRSGYPVPSLVRAFSPWLSTTLNLLSVYSSLALSLFLIARVLNGRCESLDQLHVWSCNSEYDAHALPQEVVFAMMFLPFVYSITFKAIRTPYIFMTWFIIVVGIIVAIVVGRAYQSIPVLLVYIPLSLLMLQEIHRQKVVVFLLLKKQQSLMDANKQLAEESQNELRFMIANMAHDLKTPLSAFMNGVETLTSLCREIEKSAPQNCPNINQVKENLTTLHTINSFMTMTVNRCIDYMKASKGIKLEPRLETINLQEVLSMPLNCMRDLQSRIAIMQKPIPGSVCSHIITDLQWFQENLFCLISNAVKYSSHGSIRVGVFTTNGSHDLVCRARGNSRSPHSLVSRASLEGSYRASGHEKYSFLDRLVNTNAKKYLDTGGESNQDLIDIEMGVGKSSPSKLSDSTLHSYLQSLLKRQSTAKVYATEDNRSKTELNIITSDDDLLMIEVEDTGIGLSDEAKEKLFTPFKQAQRRAGGTGLGLYSLAKRVDALGGYYGVSNRRDGEQGSMFWFAIPYRPDHSPILGKGNMTRRSIVVTDLPTDLAPIAEVTPVVASQSPLTIQTGKLRILLVDDSLPILKMTSNLLKRHGHVVDQEENGADALKALERSRLSGVPYDIVLIDLNMPVMDGLEAMKRLRATERQINRESGVLFHQRVFAFSANSDAIALAEAMEAGADDFISKPFTIQTFNEKVERWGV